MSFRHAIMTLALGVFLGFGIPALSQEKGQAPSAPPATTAAAPATAPAAPASPPQVVAKAPAEKTTAEVPAGASRTTTIVIGLIVLLLLIVLVVLGTKKQE